MTNQQLSPVVEKTLRQALVSSTDLNLLGKQVHWNIKGSRFRTLHLQLDETVDEVRVASNDVAEYLAALSGVLDVRVAAVVAASDLGQFDASYLSVDKVYSQFGELLMTVSDRVKAALDPVDDVGHLSSDILIGVVTGLGRQAWMLRPTAASG